MKKGAFGLVLHAHIPFVINHGVWPHGMDWIFEATAESYIPILNVLNKLIQEGISPRITFSFTPILLEQLAHPQFKEGFKSYLCQRIDTAKDDSRYFSSIGEPHFKRIADFWQEFYNGILKNFTLDYQEDIPGTLKRLQDDLHLEIITSAATHGYLPLLGEDPCISAQIRQGVKTYKRYMGRSPKGMWLPECGYRPGYTWSSPLGDREPRPRNGIEEFLQGSGIKYFIIDTHLLKGGKTVGIYIERFKVLKELWSQYEKEYKPLPEEDRSPYKVYYLSSKTPGGELGVFTRDPLTALQVWSGEYGYPADGWYLDFHKKRFPGGLRYWRVTAAKSDLADKQPYEIDRVEERLRENASHFKELVKSTLLNFNNSTRKFGIVCAPYDCELFGHWWFEGPRWLYYVIKWVAQDPELELSTCGDYMERYLPEEVIRLPEGSWGQGGFHWIWLNDWTIWTWKHIYEAERKMVEVASRYSQRNADHELKDVLKQLARELLLLESSDWQFLISTWTARDYAELRVCDHFDSFMRLHKMAQRLVNRENVDQSDLQFLAQRLKRNDVFPDIDPALWSEGESK